jgi:hypothetical protein
MGLFCVSFFTPLNISTLVLAFPLLKNTEFQVKYHPERNWQSHKHCNAAAILYRQIQTHGEV